MNLSPHFTLAELTRSQVALRRGLFNAPSPEQIHNLQRLAVGILEPVREVLGVPISISSGFRTRALNQIVGGARNSAHMEGLAADIVPINVNLRAAFDTLRSTQIPFDQLIIECNAWLHISLPREGAKPRRTTLSASGEPGHWIYTVVS